MSDHPERDDKKPLWLVMADAYAEATDSDPLDSAIIARGNAAEIRALRDWLVPEEEPVAAWLVDTPAAHQQRDRKRLRAELTAEAERAEAGEACEYAWKDWPEDCPECGGSLQIFSKDPRDGWAVDGETVRCMDPECGTRGQISADAEDNCYAVFPDLDP
jgi:hypothetical protein